MSERFGIVAEEILRQAISRAYSHRSCPDEEGDAVRSIAEVLSLLLDEKRARLQELEREERE